jgi:hypothetical protein
MNIGSRAQVMHGTAKMTGGGLKKKDLKYNKRGKIVSKKKSAMAKKEKRLQKAGFATQKGVFTLFNKQSGGSGDINDIRSKKTSTVFINENKRSDASDKTMIENVKYTDMGNKVKLPLRNCTIKLGYDINRKCPYVVVQPPRGSPFLQNTTINVPYIIKHNQSKQQYLDIDANDSTASGIDKMAIKGKNIFFKYDDYVFEIERNEPNWRNKRRSRSTFVIIIEDAIKKTKHRFKLYSEEDYNKWRNHKVCIYRKYDSVLKNPVKPLTFLNDKLTYL